MFLQFDVFPVIAPTDKVPEDITTGNDDDALLHNPEATTEILPLTAAVDQEVMI